MSFDLGIVAEPLVAVRMQISSATMGADVNLGFGRGVTLCKIGQSPDSLGVNHWPEGPLDQRRGVTLRFPRCR